MAAVPQGKAAYKKKDGIITLSDDQKLVTWTPLPGTGPPVVSLTISNITSERASHRAAQLR
jgi:transcription initiation factor TFIIH subunit 1